MKLSIGSKMVKKSIQCLVVVAVLFEVNIFGIYEKAFAEETPKGSCEMTIRSDQHNSNNKANASGPCAGLVFGTYFPGRDGFEAFFSIEGMADFKVDYNGQKFVIGTPAYDYPESVLTVYTVLAPKAEPKKTESKPAPKPEPKPTSKTESKAATKPTTKAEKKQAQKTQVENSNTVVVKKEETVDNGEAKQYQVKDDTDAETKLLQLLQDWLDRHENSVIEEEAKSLIALGLKKEIIPDILLKEMVSNKVKLNELSVFFDQKDVKEVKELDHIRQQLIKIIEDIEEKEEQDIAINESKDKKNSVVDKVETKEKKEEGFFKSVSSSISNFFKAIGEFFANLF